MNLSKIMARLSALMIALLMSGCTAERYFGGNGAEALVYTENHRYEIVVKDKHVAQKQLQNLVASVESHDPEATYRVEYKSKTNKDMLAKIFANYASHRGFKERVVYRYNSAMSSDLSVDIAVRKLKTQPCSPAQLQVELASPDCFVEAMRLKQVAYKSRLLGE
jgi:hypothetical protein